MNLAKINLKTCFPVRRTLLRKRTRKVEAVSRETSPKNEIEIRRRERWILKLKDGLF
jgi:hypothetical protein